MIKFLDTLRGRLKLLFHGNDAVVEELKQTKAQLRDARASVVRREARLVAAREGLSNITAHADYALKAGQPEVFLTALRDYAEEVRLGASKPQRYWNNTAGVSARARWGYDFTELPGHLTPQAPKRVTY